MFIVFQSDYNLYSIKLEELKMLADDCASAAMLYYDEEQYELGYKIFNYEEGNEAIEFILNESIGQDYWRNNVEYKVTYFDDTHYSNAYDENRLVNRYAFEYGDYYKDLITLREKIIVEPIVIVTIDGGKGDFRLFDLQSEIPNGVRSSGYEYKGRQVIE